MKEVARALQEWQRREGHAEGLTEGLAKGREEGLTEGLAKGLAEGSRRSLEFMKSIGVSPENMEKFKAMYPDIKTEN